MIPTRSWGRLAAALLRHTAFVTFEIFVSAVVEKPSGVHAILKQIIGWLSADSSGGLLAVPSGG